MTDLRAVIDDAATRGLVEPSQAGALTEFLVGRGVSVAPDITTEHEADRGSDREYPRFVRGFHDILITIGVLAGLIGINGYAGTLYVLPAVIVLSEILVKRQRLALPAVTLSVALLAALLMLIRTHLIAEIWISQDPNRLLAAFAAVPVVMGLYFWRYRVPLALALTIAAAVLFAATLFLWGMLQHYGNPFFLVESPRVVARTAMVAGFCLFAIAMIYDLRDPRRVTTRSDVAFWLHLLAAPTVLISILVQAEWQLPVVAGTIATMVLVGLVIDRRTFVTSGLISLCYLVYRGVLRGVVSDDVSFYATLVVVGAIVLTIGTLWTLLRRLVMAILPRRVRAALPPA